MESSRLIPELHVIVPSSETKMASTPSVCSTSCIPFFNPREKQVVTPRPDIRSRCLKYGDTVCR